MRELTPLEARVLAVLVEKAATVPDSYPLTLNSLQSGVNQKTARDPVMNAGETEILEAIDSLKRQSLVFETSGGRVSRYEHNAPRGINVPGDAAALLAVLVLRGPQTAAELRTNAERLHRFADIAAVEACLQALADRYPPRAVLLPRQPGARESRWAHLLCGEVVPATFAPRETGGSDDDAITVGEAVALKAEVKRQGEELARLRTLVERMAAELGMAVPQDEGAPAAVPPAGT
ncbi:YceH family protein [Ideonella sp. DXS22W]|uniref:YceH family protein n=1 Tax=Pseudaquabacterium inlustre TaxID=2984192 RepID=A0ABU9CHC1_9BURK